jgi:5-methylcytosine-specific restriction protein A
VPMRPPRACPRCGTVHGGACPGRAPAPYHARAWRRLSQSFRARFPFCGQRADGRFYRDDSQCAARGRQVLAGQVDHITPVTAGGALYAEDNLQSLCLPCHRRKTAAEGLR